MKIEGIDYSRDDKSNYSGKLHLYSQDKDEIIGINNLIMLEHNVSLVSESILLFLVQHKDEVIDMIQKKYPEDTLKDSYKELIEYLGIL